MAESTNNIRIFFGEFRHAFDGKNRVTIPARWRLNGSDEVFMAYKPKRSCIAVLPSDVFQRIGEESRALAASPAEHRLFMTHFYSQAMHANIDKQGRLLVPEELRAKAGLDGELVLTGMSDRFEIWNPAKWAARQEADRAAFENLEERMGL